jgi:hypothetical protein
MCFLNGALSRIHSVNIYALIFKLIPKSFEITPIWSIKLSCNMRKCQYFASVSEYYAKNYFSPRLLKIVDYSMKE